MINIFNIIEEVNLKCISLLKGSKISDYRIILNYNNFIDVYIILGRFSEDEVNHEFCSLNDVNLNCYSAD